MALIELGCGSDEIHFIVNNNNFLYMQCWSGKLLKWSFTGRLLNSQGDDREWTLQTRYITEIDISVNHDQN